MAKQTYGWASGGRTQVGAYLTAGSATINNFYPGYNQFMVYYTDGRLRKAAAGENTLAGWAEIPQSMIEGSTNETNGYWTASTTAGKDGKVSLIIDPSAIYCARLSTTFAMADHQGTAFDITVSSSSGSLADKQVVDLAASTDQCIFALGADETGDTDSALVMINPAKFALAQS